MRRLAILLCLLSLAACDAPEPAVPAPVEAQPAPPAPAVPAADLYVLAVGGNGFRADLGLAGLRQRYGADAVVLQELPLGEGETQSGAVIHPNDPTRRAYVYFVDGKIDGPISAIYVRDPDSIWTGPLGLKPGITSEELARINGRPFRFLGFDWDYGGYVSDWTEGLLSKAFLEPGRLAVRLAAPTLADGVNLPDGYPQGEGEFASDLPVVREQPPKVVEMGLAFTP